MSDLFAISIQPNLLSLTQMGYFNQRPGMGQQWHIFTTTTSHMKRSSHTLPRCIQYV